MRAELGEIFYPIARLCPSLFFFFHSNKKYVSHSVRIFEMDLIRRSVEIQKFKIQ